MKSSWLWGVASFFLLVSVSVFSDPLAFPCAEGSGRFSTGGRGGSVYEVTNLSNSGPGSIVDAVKAGNRTIVFRVSGTIELGDVILKPKSNTTIAGQTAPGDGICLKGRIYINTSNIIIRYIRVRVDEGGANSNGDAVDIASGSNIILDHVTASYARDEGISCQPNSNYVTVQWCLISESLTFEGHSYGSLIRGDYGDQKTYHHNLYAHNNGRNPRPGNYTATSLDPEGIYFDFRNNVVYNWKGGHPGYNADTDSTSRYNFIGNVFIRGPESSWTAAFKENAVDAYAYWFGNAYGTKYSTISVPSNQWSLVTFNGFNAAQIEAYKARSYLIPMEPVTTTSAAQALQDVLAEAGASFPLRDIIDSRIVNDVMYGTGHSIATTDDQPEGGWPTLYSLPAPVDTDHDGMPDAWEIFMGLNPANAADRNYYTLHPEYTNLEVYLNSILENDPQVPAAPTGLWARIENGQIHLDWLDNTEGNLGVYYVYRRNYPAGQWKELTETGLTDSCFIDTTAVMGTTYSYVVTAANIFGYESPESAEVFAMLSNTAMGRILREYWTDLAGSAVVDLTSSARYPDNPSGRDYLANLEGPTSWADSYGTRLRGYVHPPTTGTYVFYIASDNDSQLWLSSDGSSENAAQIASVSGATSPRQWDKYPSQRSVPISLVGGRKYFIEILHKEGSGSDHIAAAWSGPGLDRQVIAGSYLSPWFVGLYGDATDDQWVGIEDLPAFIAVWLESDCAADSAWDLNGDCVIDLYEFAELAKNWMAQ